MLLFCVYVRFQIIHSVSARGRYRFVRTHLPRHTLLSLYTSLQNCSFPYFGPYTFAPPYTLYFDPYTFAPPYTFFNSLPGTTYQQVQGNLYISVTLSQTTKHTARLPRDSNRDLVCVLGVAALILHNRQVNLIFQYLNIEDLVLHDLLVCARRRRCRDDLYPPSAHTQETQWFFTSFRSLGLVNNVSVLCVRMCANSYTHCHHRIVWHDYRRNPLTRNPGVYHVEYVQAPGWRQAVGQCLLIVSGHLHER